ncbi:glycoside hydrolase family protein [Venturia nashicola]|uniref:glucan 1,3-beta-glucosidase n=1 Tax=Venturia nashicola TaxID=86259 RepID=A0A4Z1P6U3_9PEZI|nr:glycoside hydrolase family 5 protein [Venturia nashicola]TLD23665.1 glycoside hydrolase family protein [Venturia nashicola]
MRSSLFTFATACLAGIAQAMPTLEPRGAVKFPYGQEKVRGVNLGGWFVLEPWITPSLFDAIGGAAVDEWTFCSTLGATEAKNRLSAHWSSWITASDFYAIAGAGMNHVRIPIGYWSILPIEGEPFVQGAYEVLAQALDWAQAAGLKVLIDLHGAPGSQNGFDNSGRYGPINWQQGNTVQHTLDVLNKIRDDHASHPAVGAIELLNEPYGPSLNVDGIKSFYTSGATALTQTDVITTFHDAFQETSFWNSWYAPGNLLQDTHHYEIFTQDLVALSPAAHVSKACDFGGTMRGASHLIISGEWTGAMTDCTKYLNGYAKGARFDGSFGGGSAVGSCAGLQTGSVSSWSQDLKVQTRKFIEAQLDAFESREGWLFWTWRTEGAPGWDLGDLLQNGVFPSPVTSRQYAGQCG